MRGLVLTADDFGWEPGTNAAIVSLLQDGAITATTVLAVSPFAEVALGALEDVPGAALGVHFSLTSDTRRRLYPLADGVHSLVEEDGAFSTDPARAEQSATAAHVVQELEAQIEWVTARGWTPRRLDSHSGTLYGLHGAPFVAEALESCVRHGLDFRLPQGLDLYVGEHVPPALASMHAEAVAAAGLLGVALPAQIGSNQQPCVGSYEELRRSYLDLLDRLPEDAVSEIFLHPAPETPALRALDPNGQKRVWELELLRDPVWRREITRHGIELVPHW